jgi:hypothetical protein
VDNHLPGNGYVGCSGAAEGLAIAQIKKVSEQAAIQHSGRRLPANIGDPLLEKDVVETGADGAIGITFIDSTVFSVGPNSSAKPIFSPRLTATRFVRRLNAFGIEMSHYRG